MPVLPDSPPASHARLYLVSPRRPAPQAFARDLDSVLEAADVSCLLLSVGDDKNIFRETLRAVLAGAQSREVAVLVEGDADLAYAEGADGVHVGSGLRDLRAALTKLKPGLIVGAGGLRSRHDAMEAAEAGADYVAFGEPHEKPGSNGRDLLLDRVSWWAEIFEVPCVAFADDLELAAPLSRAGADFVALGDAVWSSPEGPAAAAARLAEALSAACYERSG